MIGGNNWTRKEHKVRRNSEEPSSDLRAEFTQDGDRVSSDRHWFRRKACGFAARRTVADSKKPR